MLSVILIPQCTCVGWTSAGSVGGGGTGLAGPPKRSTSCGYVISGGSTGISRLVKLWSSPSGSFSAASRIRQPWFARPSRMLWTCVLTSHST
jgi:hypothetical protein